MQNKYYLSYMDMEKEVTKAEYIQAERSAGFRSKFGDNEIATASFGSAEGVKGRVEYKKEVYSED